LYLDIHVFTEPDKPPEYPSPPVPQPIIGRVFFAKKHDTVTQIQFSKEKNPGLGRGFLFLNVGALLQIE